nr:serine/threonine protein kinase [Desulfobulbaceae bacterium]
MLTQLINKLTPDAKKSQLRSNAAELAGIVGNSLPVMPSWKPGDTILDRYLVEEIFSGAMGKVYIAQHLGWKIPVAIKAPKAIVLADEEGAQRILNEANSWVRMGMHPNVATCYYVLNLDNVPHLFIEYVDGGNLKDWITAGRCKDLRTVLSLAIQFCHGMEFTHAQGIIHRDIKPQNILLTKNALIKITDFGIIQTKSSPEHSKAKLKGASDAQTIGFRGTPGYASPEQFKHSHQVDNRTDIFSFGICLWMMLCGKKPYKNNQVEEKLDPTSGLRNADPLPEALRHVLKKIVSFDVEKRYQDFKSLRHELNEIYTGLFKVGCPYMDLDFTDLQAENYNNRAVSLL